MAAFEIGVYNHRAGDRLVILDSGRNISFLSGISEDYIHLENKEGEEVLQYRGGFQKMG